MQNLLADKPSQETVPGTGMIGAGLVNRAVRWTGRRLQRKLVLLLTVILLGTSMMFLLMVVAFYKDQLVKEHARASMQVNHLLQASLENAMLKRDIDGLRGIVSKLGSQDGIASVMILNPHFEVRFSSDPGRLGRTISDPDVERAFAAKSQGTRFQADEDGTELLRSINPVRNRQECGECHGSIAANPVNGLLVVDYDATGIKGSALQSAILLGTAGVSIVLAAGIAIWFALQRLVVKRVQHLRRASQGLTEGKLETRAGLVGNDEIAGLGNSFDKMAGRLGQSLTDLMAAERFLQNVIDSIPDAVRVIDGDFNILKANQAYCRQIGRPMDKVVGEKCFKSSHKRKEPCPVTLISCPVAELRSSECTTMKTRQQHIQADGGELFVEVSAARVELTVDGSKLSCIIESIRDLAEQARISHEQRLSEIGQLATGVAHEIHNPLSSIQLALEAIQHEIEQSGIDQRSLEYLGTAETEIKKCLEVTNGLMTLSEPPSSSFKLIELDIVLPEVLSLLSYQAMQAGITVECDFEESLRVVASDSDMRMIGINLTQNAFHAMPQGGTVKVSGGHEGEWIKLVFKDTGVGIARANLDKVFLPFWTKRANDTDGRGLGLAICKAIVDKLKGSVQVDSTVGIGTTFTILLPNADYDRQAA
jgi:PAS domain S-box-containing protein